jgi:hypothetical protein
VRRLGRGGTAAGQATAEYAVILGAIGIGCVVAVLVLGNLINGLFQDPRDLGNQPQRFTPPTARSVASVPLTLEDCKDGRWRNYVGVPSQADCETLVQSG